MYSCKSCKENNWQYKFNDDGWVTATCKPCSKIVRFPSSRTRKVMAGIQIGSDLTAEFKKIHNQMCRKEKDGWYTTGFVRTKQGIRLKAFDLMESL
jgi:RNase P subunit RPR2